MASLNWRMLKAAMEHYLSAGSQTADEVLRPEEKLGEISHRRQLLGIGPTQLLDMPLGAKLPLLPGSNTLFYRTNLGEKLYQPPSGFDLGDPYCRLMTTKYRSLHDPHLRSYYKRKNNLRRLKKGGYVTNDNKVVCTLKEFNEYRQYLTTLKLEFEKNYMREQKMLEKQVTKLQDPILLPEGADTSHFREWLLREERENLQEQERQMRNRYVDMINKELEKIKCIAEEKHLLQQAEEEKRQHEKKKKKQPILHIKMEEEWKQKEMLLLLKIGEDVKREARIEELRRKRREEKAKKKRTVLEKKMAYHLRKLQEHTYQRVEFESHVKCLNKLLSEDPKIKNQGDGATSLSRHPSLLNKKEISKSSLSSVTSQPTSDAVMSKTRGSLKKYLCSGIDEKLLDKKPSREHELGQSPLPRSSSINDKLSLYASGEYSLQATSSTIGDLSISASVEHGEEAVSSSTSKLPISSSVVSQQGFDEIANNVTDAKRKSLQKQEVLENNMELQEHDYQREEHGSHEEGLGDNTRSPSRQPSLLEGEYVTKPSLSSLTSQPTYATIMSNTRHSLQNDVYSAVEETVLDKKPSREHELGQSTLQESSSNNDQLYLSASGEFPPQASSSYTGKVYNSESSRPDNSSNVGGFSISASGECYEEAGSSSTGAILSNRPSLNGKSFPQTFLSSLVSQQSFDEMANNVTNRALFQNTITEELNNTIENILTRVVAEVTSILYPAVTEYEERIRDTVYTISEESAFSSDNSSSCSTCNEELFDVFASLPSSSTRKIIFTDTSIKATSSPSDLKIVTGGKPTPLQSQKSSFTSLSKSTQRSLESEFWKESVHKGKTATPPHYHTESISRLRREVAGMGAMSKFPTKTFNTEKFPFSQTYFKHESATKDSKPKKGLIGEDIFSDLNQDLPKGGIFKKVFDKQTVTDANDNDNLKMLQVAENVVKEVFRRVKDLSDSVSILKKAPIELSERLFCSSFKRTEFPETFHKEFQKEIGLVAKEIVATVFDNFHKCLVSSITMASDQEPVIRRKDQVPGRRTSRVSKSEKKKIMQAELPAYDPTFSSFTIDKIAKEAVESVVFTLESFVAFQFKHDFKCKFSEIVKLPVENISSAQQTPFLRSLSTQIANEIEGSSKAFEGEMPGTTSKRTLPTLEKFQSSSDVSRVSSMITKESIESAIVQVQGLHSELNIYATIAVNNVLEIFKRKLEKEISQRQTIPLYDDSEENIMAGEIIGTVLDRCAQPQTEITLELKSGTLDMEKSGRTFGNNKIHGQGVAMSEGIKLPARKLREMDPRENFPPINVPGMVIYSEEETEMEEEIPSRLCPTIHKFSDRDAHTSSEVTKKSMYYMSAPTTRPSRPSLGTITKQRAISSRMTLPPIGKQFPRKPFSPLGVMKSPRDETRHRQVYEEHCQFMSTHETKYQLPQSQDCALPAIVVEEIISKLVSTILNSVCSTSLEHTRCLSKTEVNEITDTLKQSVKKRMSKNKISLVGAADEDQHLNPGYEDIVNQVVQSIYNSVLQETGSQPALYHDVTNCRTIFPERTASLIINEISSGQLIHSFNEESPTDNCSATEVDSTADKDLSSVSIQINIEAGSSRQSMTDANGHPAETLLQEEELPIEIIAHIRDKPLDIDPDLISDHLAVISIKTEPIEKLNETYISHSGLELPELRKASISKSSMLSTGTESDIEKRRERRSSVNALGRLDIKPKDVVCRNSFQNLKKPDVTRVELLKDVKSKEELILRLVSYDIQHDEDEDFEQIVKVDSASVFESQEYAAVEQEIMPAYESAPLADMWNNVIAAQAPEKADQYKIMEETTLTNLAGPKLDIDVLSAVSKGIPCLSESEVPETQEKDPYVNMPHAQDTEDTLRMSEIALSCEDAGNKGSSLQEKTGDAAVSESSTPSPEALVPEKVPGVLSTVFSQSCSSTSDISLPSPAAP
ncbi:fibrous sheath-interacting protein 2-like isoform X2 [Mauremys reevesii]|uniref:fibrous sheath-interacting protein 2-like isoform X2 n=1 Tax=Mauremys reevesii TaxID=260615 RepID=UPI00193F21B6|nr:fibrous sheath-interacting protein 2-like isoform X2 [Mauremys reevesii]